MTRLPINVILVLGVIYAGTSTAQAQWYVNNKASTVGESHARGMSDIVRSAGEANLNNSAAAQNWAQARSMEMENRLQYTSSYFENRRMNREYTAAERGPRPVPTARHHGGPRGVPPAPGAARFTGHLAFRATGSGVRSAART